MPDPIYSPSSEFDQGVAQDAISGLQETTVNEFEHNREIELQKSLTHIQWRYVGDVTWTNLVALSEITGANGSDGSVGGNGIDGKEVELQKGATYIQWRYVGASSWTNLIAIADLKGDAGEAGSTVESGIGMAARTILSGVTLQANADIIELNMYLQINTNAVSGTINLQTNSATNITTTLTNANTITILPTIPSATALLYSPNSRVNFKIGATLPTISLTAPAGVTYNWRNRTRTPITTLVVNTYYTILYLWTSLTECDVFYIIS